MNAPILMGEGCDPGAFLRISSLLRDPIGSRLMSQGVNPQLSDESIARLLSEANADSLRPDRAHRRWLSAVTGTATPHLMSLNPGDVHVPAIMQNIFVMYQNREFIADQVMPLVNATRLSNRVEQMPAATMQNIANAQIANQRARPNEVSYTVDNSLTYNCVPYGLLDYIPQEILQNADAAPLQTRALYMAIVRNFLDLARESRVAGEAFNSANYGSNTAALSGTDRWDNSSSDPVSALLAAKESVFVTPNVLVLGGQVWPKLRTNPAVRSYITSRASTASGPVPLAVELALFAELIGVDKVVVGRAKYNSAQEGATAVSSYLWGKSAALIRVEPNPNPMMTQTFGYTFRFGGLAYQNQVIPDLLGGAMGGEYVKLSTFDDELVIGGATTGYLYTTVIS